MSTIHSGCDLWPILIPYRTQASKYIGKLAAGRAINRARDDFPGATFAKQAHGSLIIVLVKHEDYIGFLLEEDR